MKAETNQKLLKINELSLVYKVNRMQFPVLRNINLEIARGQIYGLVGESGSGKTTLGMTLMRYLPPEGKVVSGQITFEDQELLDMDRQALRKLWGSEIALVPQDPFSSLNPSLRIGEQLVEVFTAHSNLSHNQALEKAIEWLNRVQLSDPEVIIHKYPHELSGGQKQRILVAMALSNHPQLLVLDEPTTSLDVTTEAVILDLLRDLIREENASTLFITHNLGIVAGLTDRVAVLYAGELVEDAPTNTLYQNPLHPYTRGLLESVPQLGMHKSQSELSGIPGQIPSLNMLPDGCVFAPRCRFAVKRCHEERPPISRVDETRSLRCHRWKEIESDTNLKALQKQTLENVRNDETEQLLEVRDLQVDYVVNASGLQGLLGSKKRLKAVDNIQFKVRKGETLGIVGESGSGKSSTALAIMGLLENTNGEIQLISIDLPPRLKQRTPETLRHLQMVFQSQDEAFPPNLPVGEILSRPLKNLLKLDQIQIHDRINELLHRVNLPVEFQSRLPRQLSGGEKQRVAIALAFAANPDLLIADEPVSALDVSVQANILNLLKDLQKENHTGSILISHDIAVVTYLADEVAVMYLGEILELSASKSLLKVPFHPYTEALLSAVPIADPDYSGNVIRLEGEISGQVDKPAGCPFHPRCPRILGNICQKERPPLQISNNKQIRCHIPIETLKMEQTSFIREGDRSC